MLKEGANRNISEICLEIGETVKCSGASPETCDKVDSLLVEIIQAKNEIYLQGRTDQKHEDLDTQIILTKNEIKVLQTSLIKKILATIESEYDLNCGEILLNPRNFYDLVEAYLPSDNEINLNNKQVIVTVVGNPEDTMVNLIHKVFNNPRF